MRHNRRLLPLAALACVALLVAGCGSSGGSSSSSSAGGASSTPTSSTAGAQGTTKAPAISNVGEAVAECKHIIQSQSKLSTGAKTKLEGACAQAAKGNTAAVKKAAREVCEEVIAKSGALSGSAREEALKVCQK